MAMIVQTDDPVALTPEKTPPYELCRKVSGLQSRSESFKQILPPQTFELRFFNVTIRIITIYIACPV
jgi:hypothetical protein